VWRRIITTSPWRWREFASRPALVQQLAHQGHCDAAARVSLNSVIDLNPGSLGVFGGSETNLRLGLETLLGVLNASNRQGLNAELTRYTLSLMVLERN
jgi:high frequency lysogenization protein